MNTNPALTSDRRTRRAGILFTSIASLIAAASGFAADAALTSGAITGDADSGVSSAKTYVALGNIIGGDVTVNGQTFLGTGTSGTGWALSNVGATFGSGGNHTTTFGGQSIAGLFDGFQFNGNPGTLTLSGLTAGQTYVATLYNEAWGLGADRTQNITTSEGAALTYNEDALEASVVRYTFVATSATTTVNFSPKIPGNTMHFYGVSNEQVFNNTWNGSIDGTWNEPANWSTNTPASGIGRSASFIAQSVPTTVTLGGATTVGHLEFKGTGSYTVAGAAPLTLQADAGGISVINANAGSHTIGAPIALNSDLAKFGAGTVTTTGISGAKAVSVSGGTLRFAAANSYTGGTSVSNGAILDLNGTSQSLGTLNGAGALSNGAGGTSVATVDSGTFAGTIGSGVSLSKNTTGVLTLTGSNTAAITATVNGGTLKLQTGATPLITDNFSATGNPDTANLNFNLANRQTGSLATQNWTPAGNTQVGNTTGVQQPQGVNGDYLLLAFGASATLGGLPLSTANVAGPVKINFDMFKGTSTNGDPTEWTSFRIGATAGAGFPVAGSGELGFLYRRNTGIQLFNNGGAIQSTDPTSGNDTFGFYLADSAGTGSPFAGNGTRVVVTQGGNIVASHALNTGMGTSFLTFGSSGPTIGGVDNLAVNNFKTNVLAPTTDVSLTTAGAKFELDGVHQTVASLNGAGGTEVAMGPFSRLTVNGGGAFNGTITGATATFAKSGSAPLSLGAANTYGGGTNIQSGPVFAFNVAALGSGAVNIGAGGNYLPWFNTGSPVIPHNFTLNGLGGDAGDGLKSAIYADGGVGGYGEYLLTGSVTLAATSNMSGHNTNNLRVLGQITGPGGLTKGSGRVDETSALILNNPANNYAGDTTILNGTLKLGASEVIPHGDGKGRVIMSPGTTFDLAGNNETINNLSGSGTVTSSAGVVIGAPAFFSTNVGSGIDSGKTYSHALDFGDGTAASVNGVAFEAAANSGTNWSLTGAGNLLPEGAGSPTSPTFGDGANGTGMNQLFSDFYYNGNPAVLTLSGLTPGATYETHLYNRQWGGDRTQLFQVNAGGSSGALLFNQDGSATPSYLSFRYTADGSGTASITTTQIGTGTYHWYGATNEVVTAAPAATQLTVGDASDSTFSGNITGPIELTKTGSGTLELSGNNTQTGATFIAGGKLLINGTMSNTELVVVNAGTLGGSGSINPAANVFVVAGAEVSPGNSIGTLSAGPVSFLDTSTFSIEIGVSTADQLIVAGAGSISGTINLNLSLLGDPTDDTYFTLIDGTSPFDGYASGGRFSYSGNSLDEGETFVVTSGAFSQEFTISYAADAGKDVTVHATPEPGSAALLLLGGVAFLRRRRRD